MPSWISGYSLLFLVPSLVLIAVGLPLRSGRVPRNGLYGIRIPRSYASDEAWYAINRYGGEQFVRGGIAMLLFVLAGLFLPWSFDAIAALMSGAFLLCTLVPAWMSIRFARRR